jgi:hypothetical protein
MTIAVGGRRLETWLSGAQTRSRTTLGQLVWLAVLGVAAVAYHAATRGMGTLPPGHQGVFWIGALMVGRLTVGTRFAATTTAVTAGAVSMLPIWGLGDPFRPLEYLIAGGAIDLGFAAFGRWSGNLWLLLPLLVPLGGLAHATKPLLRLGINLVTGWPYGSLLWGVAYPVGWHFVFGAAGAAIAVTLLALAKRRNRDATA